MLLTRPEKTYERIACVRTQHLSQVLRSSNALCFEDNKKISIVDFIVILFAIFHLYDIYRVYEVNH